MSDPAASKRVREEGNTFFRQGRWADAAAAYGRAIAADESDALPRANRAMAWLKLEKYADAAADATAALALDPTHIKARYRRALARRGLGDLDGAAADLSTVIARDDSPAAREELAEVYAEIVKGTKAAKAERAGRVKEAKEKEEADNKAREAEIAEDKAKVAKEKEETQPVTSFAALRGKRDARPAYAHAPGLTPVSTKSTSARTLIESTQVPSPAPAPAQAPSSEPTAPSKPNHTPIPIPPNPTSTSPGAGLALLRALRPLTPPHRFSYLRHYPAHIIPRILSPTMDPESLGMLLTSLDTGMGGEWTRQVMADLRRTPRWGMNVAMLSRSEKEAGERAWSAAGGEGTYL
ncbi:hypothetical protein CspHIS471_0305900 [Cutaneotrichosporon sp. HIS471]|nr:hypothetical protein CspHIS471_0305900 [Cutaneotrichosporon sp. HIS471]